MLNKIGIRILIFFSLLILLLGGGWWWWNDAGSAVDPASKQTQIFVVSDGEGVRSIANKLKSSGLIRDQIGFFLRVKLSGYSTKLQVGDFRLSPAMNTATIIQELTHGTLDVWVTTLEGWRNEEIAVKLTQTLAIPESEFLKYAQEGYMFPDTYLLPKDASAAAIVEIFSDNYAKKVTPEIKEAIKKQKLTLEQGIILASIVEREGRTAADRPLIAGILLKRLKNDWPLQTDATIQYALGYQSSERNWWKKTLLDEDKNIKSPYNSYKNLGLPPAPICNPGLESIQAVVNPKTSDYWYYLHDAEGQARYAKTLEEHNANVTKYLQ